MAFFKPLYGLIQLALNTDLHSHLILIPVASVYFAWIKKGELPVATPPNKTLAIATAIAAAALSAYYWTTDFVSVENGLAASTLAYVLLIIAAALFCFGPNVLRTQSFSLWFLIFFVPMPLIVQDWANTFFQYTSAEVSYQMVKSANISIFRPGPLTFELSTIQIHVAPSCSGIRSSLVLVITSIVAGELFLNSKWKRWFLVLFVIPLAIVRNAFRISTISYLCVHIGPHMIDHWIHHKGGPFFFGLSLIPFFALLYWLWKKEKQPIATIGD
ncbi:MAG: archaeosortase/exosortase family protein [Opitutales bacterium]|nr:archaeosortase/exosortase family protein [Opitutales bacterium]